MPRIAVALGGNLGNVPATFQRAIGSLTRSIGELLSSSSLYRSRALSVDCLPWNSRTTYCNMAVLMETAFEPGEVLTRLLKIEEEMGRDRARERDGVWLARTLDLDLIFAGDIILKSPQLTLPHPRMHERDFVLLPLLELCPKWRHPLLDRTVEELSEGLRRDPSADGLPVESGVVTEVAGTTPLRSRR